jgi:8-oxo-dGTP pyrophosphatase MutT (NUDIX family)
MSDREIILNALASVRRRLQLTYAVHDGIVVLCLIAVALLLWRGLRMAGDYAPAATAVAILIALLLWIGGLFVLLRGLILRRTTLSRAATEADARAALDDELQTAYWFIEHPAASPWIAAQLERAAHSARALDISRLLPLRVERGTLAASGLASLLLMALWFAPPLSSSSPALSQPAGGLSAAETKQVQLLRDLAAQLSGDPASAQVEHALRTLQRPDASAEEKQRALAAAREALEQRNLEAASTREGL